MLWENATITAACKKGEEKSENETKSYHISLSIPEQPIITPDSGKYLKGVKIYMKTKEDDNE